MVVRRAWRGAGDAQPWPLSLPRKTQPNHILVPAAAGANASCMIVCAPNAAAVAPARLQLPTLRTTTAVPWPSRTSSALFASRAVPMGVGSQGPWFVEEEHHVLLGHTAAEASLSQQVESWR